MALRAAFTATYRMYSSVAFLLSFESSWVRPDKESAMFCGPGPGCSKAG